MTAGEYLRVLQDRRRANLKRLVDKTESQTELARQMSIDRPQLSSMLSGRLTISEFRARKVEQFLGLGYGALDLELP